MSQKFQTAITPFRVTISDFSTILDTGNPVVPSPSPSSSEKPDPSEVLSIQTPFCNGRECSVVINGDHMAVPEAEEYDYVTLDDVAHLKHHHKRKTSTNSLLSTTSSYNGGGGGGGSVRLSDDAWSYTNSSIGTWESPDLVDEVIPPEEAGSVSNGGGGFKNVGEEEEAAGGTELLKPTKQSTKSCKVRGLT